MGNDVDEFATRGEVETEPAEAVKAEVSDPELTEDLTLALLKRPDLQPEFLQKVSKNSSLMKSRKVKLALVEHPKTPRHVLLPLLRHLFTFDLMRVALRPTIAAEIRVAAEESLINRLEKLSLGEKLSLARRASGRVAGALLHDSEPRMIGAALQNSRLTEAAVIKELSRRQANSQLVTEICAHPKWSVRKEIKIALLRNENTPIDVAATLARALSRVAVQEIIEESHLSEERKSRLWEAIASSAKDLETKDAE